MPMPAQCRISDHLVSMPMFTCKVNEITWCSGSGPFIRRLVRRIHPRQQVRATRFFRIPIGRICITGIPMGKFDFPLGIR